MNNIPENTAAIQPVDFKDYKKTSVLPSKLCDEISMFDIAYIKKKLGKRKLDELLGDDTFTPYERPLLYYSILPEYRWKDKRFLKLTRHEKGDFCLFIDPLWQGCGSIRTGDVAQIAIDLGIPELEMRSLIKKLLEVGLLVERQGRYVQEELRSQHRYTCSTNNNMKRPPAPKATDVHLDEPFS